MGLFFEELQLPTGEGNVGNMGKKKIKEEEIEQVEVVIDDARETMEVAVLDQDDFVPDVQPMVATIEEDDGFKLSSDEAREHAVKLKNSLQDEYIELCRTLYHIRIKQLYSAWGFGTFDEYVQRELEFEKSKARYLSQIWENLYIRQGDKTIFSKVMLKLKWTKATIVQHVVNAENVDGWVERGLGMSCEELRKEVKRFLDKKISDDPREALESADEVEGTPMENVMKSVNLQLHHDDYLAFCQAVEMMQKIQPGISTSQSVANICRDFMSSNPDNLENPQATTVEFIKKFEKQTSLRFVVLDVDSKEVLHGFESLKDITHGLAEEESEHTEEVELIDEDTALT